MTRTWCSALDGDGVNVVVAGTVETFVWIGEGRGALTLRDVPQEMRGMWAAPSQDHQQTTTVDLL